MITAIVIFFAAIIGILVLALILFSVLRSRQRHRNKNHLAETGNPNQSNSFDGSAPGNKD